MAATIKLKLVRWVGSERQVINVEIDLKGKLSATVEGVAGPACADVSKFLDEMGVVEVDEPTPDFYQAASDNATLYTGGGGQW